MTGEPILVEKTPMDPVTGGTIDSTRTFVMEARRVGGGTLAQIVRMVGTLTGTLRVLETRSQPQQCRLVHSELRLHRSHPRLALGERAAFVHDNRRDFPEDLQTLRRYESGHSLGATTRPTMIDGGVAPATRITIGTSQPTQYRAAKSALAVVAPRCAAARPLRDTRSSERRVQAASRSSGNQLVASHHEVGPWLSYHPETEIRVGGDPRL